MKYGLDELVEEYGFDSAEDMAEEYSVDSIIPAICTSCGATYEYEPDCEDGSCDECDESTVQSLFVLMGVI